MALIDLLYAELLWTFILFKKKKKKSPLHKAKCNKMKYTYNRFPK